MQLQGELALIWLETNPPNAIFLEMRSLSGAPHVFPSVRSSTTEGTGIGKGGRRPAQHPQQ